MQTGLVHQRPANTKGFKVLINTSAKSFFSIVKYKLLQYLWAHKSKL